jgi:hypothetical protein
MAYYNNPLPIPANVNISIITVHNGTTPQEETSCTCSRMIWLFLSILQLSDRVEPGFGLNMDFEEMD